MDLVLKKSVYLYEYIDNWQRFNEMFLPGKKKKLQQPDNGRYHEC